MGWLNGIDLDSVGSFNSTIDISSLFGGFYGTNQKKMDFDKKYSSYKSKIQEMKKFIQENKLK